MAVNQAIIGFCGLCVLFLLYAEHTDNARLRWLAKPAASLAFLALGASLGGFESDYGRLIMAGLFLCLIGDVLLIPRGEVTFLAGMGAFALGHLSYAGAFLTVFAGYSGPALFAAAITIVAVGLILRNLWPHLGAFKGPVAGYVVVIAMMMILSFATASPGGGTPYWLAVLGAVGFAVSDISVARDQFIAREFFNRVWGLPLYYGSQLMLAASVSPV